MNQGPVAIFGGTGFLGGRLCEQLTARVDDVALAMMRSLERPDAPGKTYELGGDEVLSLRALLERLCQALQRRPWLVPVPFAAAETLAWLSQRLPGAPLTVDQVRLLRTDKVVLDSGRAPAALGVTPRPLDEFLATLGTDSHQPI